MKIEPGDICVVIGEDRGCESNIGAMLTVVEIAEDWSDRDAWVWINPSRPIACINPCGEIEWWPENHDGDCTIPGRFLVPIRGLDPDGEMNVAVPSVKPAELEPA